MHEALTPWKKEFPEIASVAKTVSRQIKPLFDKLEGFRNATFHFDLMSERHVAFILDEKQPSRHSAEILHSSFRKFFEIYRERIMFNVGPKRSAKKVIPSEVASAFP